MKKQLLQLCLFACLGLSTYAQITITKADLTFTATTSFTGRDTSSFINPGPAGASQVWDFTSFTPANIDSGFGDLSNNTPNPLFPEATHGSCGTTSIGTICSYLHISDTGFYFIGTENTFNMGFASRQVAKVTPVSLVYPFPLTYNQTKSQAYVQHQLNVNASPSPNDSIRFVYYRTVALSVDAWGTLKTPYNTYNTIRVKKINSNLDTTYTHAVGGSWTKTGSTILRYDTSYVWLANGVMEVANMSKYSPTVYRYSFLKSRSTSTGLNAQQTAISGVKIYPNPATNKLVIESTDKIGSIVCTNTMGQACAVSLQADILDVSTLNPGIYFLEISTENGETSIQKFVKQ